MTIATVALAIAPSIASADGYFVPFIGANYGGDVGVPLDQVSLERNRLTYGFGVGGMMGVSLASSSTSVTRTTSIPPKALWVRAAIC